MQNTKHIVINNIIETKKTLTNKEFLTEVRTCFAIKEKSYRNIPRFYKLKEITEIIKNIEESFNNEIDSLVKRKENDNISHKFNDIEKKFLLATNTYKKNMNSKIRKISFVSKANKYNKQIIKEEKVIIKKTSIIKDFFDSLTATSEEDNAHLIQK